MAGLFCYIAHKDGYWSGLCAADVPPKFLAKFMSDHAKDGCQFITCATREEYLKKLDTMKPWNESPDYKPKRKRKAA